MRSKVVKLQQACWELMLADPEVALAQAQESYDLAIIGGHDALVPYSLRLIGLCQMYGGQFPEAVVSLEQAIDAALTQADTASVARCYNNLAATHFSMGQFNIAAQYYETALSLAKHLNDKNAAFSMRCNLAELYETLEDRVACDHLIEMLDREDLTAIPDDTVCAYYYIKIQQCLDNGQLDQFADYYGRARALAIPGNYRQILFQLQVADTRRRYLQGDEQAALQQVEELVLTPEFHLQGIDRYKLYLLLAQWYVDAGYQDPVEDCLHRALALDAVPWPHQILRNLFVLVSGYLEQKGDFKKALHFANEAHRWALDLQQKERGVIQSSRANAAKALAQETARVHKRLEHRALEMVHEQTLLINKIGRSLASTLDLKVMGERLFEALLAAMPVTTISLVEYELGSSILKVRLAVEKGVVISDGLGTFDVKNTYSQRVINSHKTEVCNDFGTDADKMLLGTTIMPKSALFLPLMLGDQVFGVWSVQSEVDHAYLNSHTELVEAVAPFVAIAFNNALTHLNNVELIGALHTEKLAVEVAHKAVAHQALHDELTGLPNRIALSQFFLEAVAAARRQASTFHILFMDMNGFKQVNDTQGHSIGDEVLRATGLRLKGFFRNSDFVCRLGGDEFVAIVPAFSDRGHMDLFIDRIRSKIAKDMSVHDVVFKLGVSVGLATFPEDGESLDTLLMHADKMMYQDKLAKAHKQA